jgi:HSP20 family protein
MQTNQPNANQSSANQSNGGGQQANRTSAMTSSDASRSSDRTPSRYGTSSSPFGSFFQLSREMDELLESFFGRSGRTGAQVPQLWQPRVDVRQKGDQLVISAELPGVPRESVQIDCSPEGIAISGERKESREEDDAQSGYHFSERSYGQFYRTIPLPEGADGEQARATMKEGVLEITVPMKPAAQRRRIEIT